MDNKNEESFWQFSDQLRVQGSSLANLSLNNDYSIWSNSYSSKRPDQRRNFDVKGTNDDGWKMPINSNNNNSLGAKGIFSFVNNNNNHNYNYNYKSSSSGLKGEQGFQFQKKKQGAVDAIAEKKLKKTQLAVSECLGRNERVGGYIFVCNNETMEENLQRKLFGLPPRYRDSVRSITPGMPLFLYNYSTHQLHGIFEAASFGGTNIDPTAWEDNKCPGESRFPAQVQVITRKVCEPLGEDSFRPILHHYDGPKFRLQLTLPEALSLLDIFADQNSFHHIFKAIPA